MAPNNRNTTKDSWHDSLPFALPNRRRANHRSVTNLLSMRGSSIYKRNEARMLKNHQAISDDPRPKALRILSFLPGMNMIVPPYDPQLHGIRKTNEKPQELWDIFPDANIVMFGAAASSTTAVHHQVGLSLIKSIAIAGVSAASAQLLFHRTVPTSPFAPSGALSSSSASSFPSATSIVLTATGDLKLKRAVQAASAPVRLRPGVLALQNIVHAPFWMHATSGLALPFIVREQLNGGMPANIIAAICSGCFLTWVPLLSTKTTFMNFRTVSSPLFGSQVMLALTSLTLYDAAAPHGIISTAIAGVTAGTINSVVRQQRVSRSAMLHASFFAIYRSLYCSVVSPNDSSNAHTMV